MAPTSADVSSLTAAGVAGEVPPASATPAGFVGADGRRSWTPDRVAELRRLAAEGWSDAQMGAHFGGLDRSGVMAARRRYHVPAGRKAGSAVTRSALAKAAEPIVAEGWAKGWSNVEIAQRAGVSDGTVSRVARTLGLPKRQGRRKAGPVKDKTKTKTKTKSKAKAEKAVKPQAKVEPLPPRLRPAVVAPDAGVPMIALEAGECRWPVGEDAKGRHLFCAAGAVEGRPYCADHEAVAVVPTVAWRVYDSDHRRTIRVPAVKSRTGEPS